MATDQLVLDIKVNGADAQRALADLDAKVKATPQTAQQAAAGVEAAAQRQSAAMEREATKASAAVNRELTKAADAAVRESQRALAAEQKDWDKRFVAATKASDLQAKAVAAAAADQQRVTAASAAAQRATLQDLEGQARRTQSGFEGLSVSTVAKGGLAAGALLAVGAAAAQMAEQGVRAATDLEHSVASIATIKPDVDTSAVLKSLNDLQTQVPQTAKQLGDSLYDVFSSIDNVTQEQGLKLVETFAKGAVAAQTDAKTFGTAISGVLNAYKLDTSEATKVSDVFFNTVNRGVVTGQQLAAGLGPAIAAAKALGVSYEEAFALIVGATKEGGDAAQNINNITNLFSKLPTKEATTDLNALGIATQTTAGALRSPVAVLTDLKAKLDGMTESARATTLLQIFPDLQARQGAQVVMSQLATVNTALAENNTATNSTAEAYRKMSATAIEQGKLLSNTWTALLTDLSAVTLPALVGALGLVGEGVRDLRGTFETASIAVGEASTTIQTKTAAIQGDLDTLTTYADTNLRPQWDAFWKAATGGNYPMPPLPTRPPAPTLAQQEAAVGLGPTPPQYVPGVTPAPPEQTRSPFGGPGAGHLSPEESGLGPLGNIRGQFENMWEDMAESNARHAAGLADAVANDFSAQLLRRKPMMHAAGVELGDAAGEGVTDGLDAATPAARSAALVTRDLEEARKRAQVADLGGAVAIREHTEALHQDEIAALGGAVAVRDHADALQRQQVAALGGAAAIRDHDEALAREKEQALGGAFGIRAHEEALARQKEAALGGALAIRGHEEALARDKEANLGGALAIRDHAEALQREHEAALGGVATIRDHEDQLNREKTAALGGEVGIRAHTEALEREKVAAVGGYAGIRDHEDALNREKTAALGGEVGIRAHAEALNEEKIAALGGRAAILDHEAALHKLDIAAQQSQSVFATLADQMANYAKSTNANAVQLSQGYASANKAVDAVMGELTGTLQAQVKAAQNAGDAYGALSIALEHAGVGYQDIAGLINGERGATERLNEAIQDNVRFRQQQRAATEALTTAQRAAIQATATGADPNLGRYGAQPGAASSIGVSTPSMGPLVEAYMRNHPEAMESVLTQIMGPAEGRSALGAGATQQNELAAELQRRAEQEQNIQAGQQITEKVQQEANAATQGATAATQGLATTTENTTQVFLRYQAGTGLATRSINELVSGPMLSAAQKAQMAADAFAEAAATGWKAAQANAEALQAGQIIIGGFKTQVGLTYGQIYGNTGNTGAGGGGSSPTRDVGQAIGNTVGDTLTPVLQQTGDKIADAITTSMTGTIAPTLAQTIRDSVAASTSLTGSAPGYVEAANGPGATGRPYGSTALGMAALSEQVSYNTIYQQLLEQRASSATQSWVGTLDLTQQAMVQFVVQTQGAMAGAAYAGSLTGHSLAELTAAAQAATTALSTTAAAAGAPMLMVGNTPVTQILPGTPLPGGIGGITQAQQPQTLLPGNYFGVPVVSPITGGSLRGYADGGPVDVPTILVNQATGRAYARAGENGPEWVGPRGGGGAPVTVNIYTTGVDALRDDSFWDRAVQQQIRPALKRVGVGL